MFGRNFWSGRYGRLFFSPEDDGNAGGGGGGNEKAGETKPDDPLAGLTDAQKAVIQKQIDSAASAARKAGERDGLTKAQSDANAKAESDRVAKEQADAIKAGEFEKAKGLIEQEREAAKAESKAHADKLERAEKALTVFLDERIKALAELKDADLSAEFAAITDPLDQLDWFNRASTKRAMGSVEEAAQVAEANGKPREPITPKPKGPGTTNDDAARAAMARSYRDF